MSRASQEVHRCALAFRLTALLMFLIAPVDAGALYRALFVLHKGQNEQ